jgi:hypothetical protein
MRTDMDEKQAAQPDRSRDTLPQEWLTDVMDQLARSAFQRALERRHAAPDRTVIESAQLVATTPQ